jgi:hypothetical protein
MNKHLAQTLQLPWFGPGGKGSGTTTVTGVLAGGNSTLGIILSNAMKLVFLIAGVSLLFMLLAGGFTLLTSAGDAKKLQTGQQQITNAILGIIIIFVAFWMVQIIGTILGFDTIKAIFG